MKIVPLPPLRIDPELRAAAQSAPREGETLTPLTETSLRETGLRRRAQDEFLTRGRSTSEAARRTGRYHPASVLHAEIKQRVNARRNQVLG